MKLEADDYATIRAVGSDLVDHYETLTFLELEVYFKRLEIPE
jgi:hypothetical protein